MSTASSNSYFFTVIEAKTIVSVNLLPLKSNQELYRLYRYSYRGLRNWTGPSYFVTITVQRHTRIVFLSKTAYKSFKWFTAMEKTFLFHYSLQFTSDKV